MKDGLVPIAEILEIVTSNIKSMVKKLIEDLTIPKRSIQEEIDVAEGEKAASIKQIT